MNSKPHFDWNKVKVLLALAREGSLSAAGKSLGLAQPTMGRQISALENELGVTLVEREGKAVQLTSTGFALVEYAEKMSHIADDMSLFVTGKSQSMEGLVTISSTDIAATYILPQIICDLRKKEPGIEIELVSTNDVSDLRKREADIAIRNVRPLDPELVAKKLPEMDAGLYGSKFYLKSLEKPLNGLPKNSDLKVLKFVGFTQNHSIFLQALRGVNLVLEKRHFPVVAENHLVHWSLVKANLGLGVMLTQIGEKDPEVERVFPMLPPLKVQTWLVAHKELKTNYRIRTVFDFLDASLQNFALTGRL